MHIQEAMAAGCIPIVTAGGPTDDIVNDENGIRISTNMIIKDLTTPEVFAVKPGDSLTMMGAHGAILEPIQEDLNAKLHQLIQHPQRDEIMTKLRDAPKNLHTWDKVCHDYNNFLEQIDTETPPKRFM